jgi:hypothetical protein
MSGNAPLISEREKEYIEYAISTLPQDEAEKVIEDVVTTLEKVRATIAAQGEPDDIALTRQPNAHPLSGPIVAAILYRRGRTGGSYAAARP